MYCLLQNMDHWYGLMSYAILEMESTTANVDKISYTPCPIPTTESYKFLEMGLGKQRRIDHISPDGNCLFRLLSKELLGHEKFPHLMRQILMKFIKENDSKFRAYVIGESVENHCKRIENLGEWGTQAEIFAAATILKIQIFVFTCKPGSQEYHWLCYKPLGRGYSVSKCPTSVQKLWKLTPPSNYHIELIHSFQNHFDRVAPSDLTCTSMEKAPHLSDTVDFITL